MSWENTPMIKDWTPVVYTLSEAEAHVFCGKLQDEGIPAVVLHSSMWTQLYGLSFSDNWVVLAPKASQEGALKALDLRQPLNAFDRKQVLGRRYDFWLSQGLGFYGWPIILLRMLWSRLRRAGKAANSGSG